MTVTDEKDPDEKPEAEKELDLGGGVKASSPGGLVMDVDEDGNTTIRPKTAEEVAKGDAKKQVGGTIFVKGMASVDDYNQLANLLQAVGWKPHIWIRDLREGDVVVFEIGLAKQT